MADEKKNASPPTEFTPPDWITPALMQTALHNGGEENSKVVDLQIRLATAPGDNYASFIYRVKVSLSDGGSRSLLVKGPVPGTMANMTKELGIFKRESYMLADIVPKIEALLHAAAPGRFSAIAARCPHHGTSPVDFLVLEDLKPSGFELGDRHGGLDLRHSMLAVRSLARYHAAGHALLKRHPNIMDNYPNVWMQPNEGLDHFVRNALQSVIDGCKVWPGYEEFVPPLEKHKIDAMKSVMVKCLPKPGTFTVISHGDFWVNNMMFRYEFGSPKEHRAVDFQGSTASSPAIDLLYFLSTSVTEEVSTHHEDLLMREYHDELKDTLSLLGLQAPSFEAFLADVDAHGCFALVGTLMVIPIVKAQKAPDLGASLTGDQSAVSYLYEAPELKRWLQRVLPIYKQRGWL